MVAMVLVGVGRWRGVTGLQVAVILSLGLLRPSLGLWKAWGGQGT